MEKAEICKRNHSFANVIIARKICSLSRIEQTERRRGRAKRGSETRSRKRGLVRRRLANWVGLVGARRRTSGRRGATFSAPWELT